MPWKVGFKQSETTERIPFVAHDEAVTHFTQWVVQHNTERSNIYFVAFKGLGYANYLSRNAKGRGRTVNFGSLQMILSLSVLCYKRRSKTLGQDRWPSERCVIAGKRQLSNVELKQRNFRYGLQTPVQTSGSSFKLKLQTVSLSGSRPTAPERQKKSLYSYNRYSSPRRLPRRRC